MYLAIVASKEVPKAFMLRDTSKICSWLLEFSGPRSAK